MKYMFLFVSILGWMVTLAQDNDYLVYAVTDEGDYPLPEDIDDLIQNDPKNFIRFRWGEYLGPKLRIGVLNIENIHREHEVIVRDEDGNEIKRTSGTKQIPIQSIESMVTDGLVNTNRFQIIERQALNALLAEQDKSRAGITTKESAPKSGFGLGAKYLIKVEITDYEPEYSNTSAGLGNITGGAVKLNVGKSKSMVSLAFRLIDSQSGTIIYSKQVQVIVSKKNFGASGREKRLWGKKQTSGSFSNFSKTPIANALRAAINVGVFELVKKIGNEAVSGVVAMIKDDEAIITLGKETIQVGDELKAFTKGEEIIDPTLGISLGSDEEYIGKMTVTRVKPRFCYSEAVDFEIDSLQRGDRVELISKLHDLRFAETWEGPRKKSANLWKNNKRKKKEKRNRELREKANAKSDTTEP